MRSKPKLDLDGAPILKSASIKRFGLFSDETLEFSPGLNIFIGRNGCGKSHLIKLLYTLVRECGGASGNGSALEAERLDNRLASKLAGVFRPEGDRIGRLVQRNRGRGSAEVSAAFSNGKKCGFTLSTLDRISKARSNVPVLQEAAFLRSREVLALFEGFIAAYKKRELSFDETFYDSDIGSFESKAEVAARVAQSQNVCPVRCAEQARTSDHHQSCRRRATESVKSLVSVQLMNKVASWIPDPARPTTANGRISGPGRS